MSFGLRPFGVCSQGAREGSSAELSVVCEIFGPVTSEVVVQYDCVDIGVCFDIDDA